MEIDNSPVELGVDSESGRIGVKRIVLDRRTKRARISQGRYEYDNGESEWIWGGGKQDTPIFKDGEEQEQEWIIKKAHWRLRVEPMDGEGGRMQVVLCGVRIEGFSLEKSRNRSRGFLGT
jgi:hypothetical protein